MNPAFMTQPEEAEETITPTDSSPETKEEEATPSQEGEPETPDVEDLPFHKHPRWIAKQREIEELRSKVDNFEKFQQEVSEHRPPASQQAPEMPDWWKDAFGTDEASQKAFQKQVEHEQNLYAQWENKVIERVRNLEAEEARQHQETVAKYEKQIEDNFSALEDRGYKFDRNELLKVVEEYSTDAEGNYLGVLFPFDKAYEILQLKKSVPTPTDKARAKAAELSSTGTKSGSNNNKTMPTITELRQRGWSGWRND